MFTTALRVVAVILGIAAWFAACVAIYRVLSAIGTRFINAAYRKFGFNGGLVAAVTWVAGLATVTSLINRRFK